MKDCIKVKEDEVLIPLKLIEMITKVDTMSKSSVLIKRHIERDLLLLYEVEDISDLPEDVKTVLEIFNNECRLIQDVVEDTNEYLKSVTNYNVGFDMSRIMVSIPHDCIEDLKHVNEEELNEHKGI